MQNSLGLSSFCWCKLAWTIVWSRILKLFNNIYFYKSICSTFSNIYISVPCFLQSSVELWLWLGLCAANRLRHTNNQSSLGDTNNTSIVDKSCSVFFEAVQKHTSLWYCLGFYWQTYHIVWVNPILSYDRITQQCWPHWCQ